MRKCCVNFGGKLRLNWFQATTTTKTNRCNIPFSERKINSWIGAHGWGATRWAAFSDHYFFLSISLFFSSLLCIDWTGFLFFFNCFVFFFLSSYASHLLSGTHNIWFEFCRTTDNRIISIRFIYHGNIWWRLSDFSRWLRMCVFIFRVKFCLWFYD